MPCLPPALLRLPRPAACSYYTRLYIDGSECIVFTACLLVSWPAGNVLRSHYECKLTIAVKESPSQGPFFPRYAEKKAQLFCLSQVLPCWKIKVLLKQGKDNGRISENKMGFLKAQLRPTKYATFAPSSHLHNRILTLRKTGPGKSLWTGPSNGLRTHDY